MSNTRISVNRFHKTLTILILQKFKIALWPIANLEEILINIKTSTISKGCRINRTTIQSTNSITIKIGDLIIHDYFSIQEFLTNKRIRKIQSIRGRLVYRKISMNKQLITNLIHQHMTTRAAGTKSYVI